MEEALIKLQIKGIEQQLKILKFKIASAKKGKTLSDLCGFFKGKMNLSLEEIEKYEYSFKHKL
ncbi:hypothetical protein M1M93_01135 [Thermodesulfovibrionales bacterium]|nr:hypothetical protein [Thermodesulfovibrionales bacterium]